MSSPVVARRRLGAELRRLRMEAGVSVDAAATALDCSASKISRLETGLGVPRARDVRDLIELIGGEAGERADELLALAEVGRAQAWYHEFGDLLEPGSSLQRFIALETGAAEELVYGGAWVPGLVQTPEYAEALFLAFGRSGPEVERLVELRMGRKQALTRPEGALRLTAIVDESVLHRAVGGPAVMGPQLEALCSLALEPPPNVRVALLPFAAGMHKLLAGDLTVLRFEGEDDQDVVLAEGHAAQGFEERPDEVEAAVAMFESAFALTVGGQEMADRVTECRAVQERARPAQHRGSRRHAAVKSIR
jgi:transcriptional regulator with XRE-family HTH domain